MTSQSTWTHEPTGSRTRAASQRRIKEQAELLSKVPLFAGLSRRHMHEIAKVSGSRTCAVGEELVHEGAAGSVFFVLVEGTAKVVRNGRTVKRLGPGDFFGEMSLLADVPRSASVLAQAPVRCLTLSAKGLRSVLRENPPVAMRLLTTMAERLAETDKRLFS